MNLWVWLNELGLDVEYIEANEDLLEYWQQQYDITFNLKEVKDYDIRRNEKDYD